MVDIFYFFSDVHHPAPLLKGTKSYDTMEKENIEELERRNEALTKENKELRDENERLKNMIKSCKRPIVLQTSTAPAKKLKTPLQRKRLLEKWAKALTRGCPREKFYTNDMFVAYLSVNVKESTAIHVEDFEHIFGGAGTLIQPTPENKPTSVTTIRRYSTEELQTLFGPEFPLGGYDVTLWRKREFQKPTKLGQGLGDLRQMDAVYNRSKLVLELRFSLCVNES